MDQQPRTEPPRRTPAKAAPRPRVAKSASSPAPASAEPPASAAGKQAAPTTGNQAVPAAKRAASTAGKQAASSRKPAPPVLFQPPAEQRFIPAAAGQAAHPDHDAPAGGAPRATATESTPADARPEQAPAAAKSAAQKPAAAKRPAPKPTAQRPATDKADNTEKTVSRATRATPAKKATATKRAASRTAVPAKSPHATPVAEPTPTRIPDPPTAPAARIVGHPGYAPELLALTAVTAIGPRARSWADQMRAVYPTAPADGLARLATQRFVRLSLAAGPGAAVSGLLAPVAEFAALAWIQAGLVLHLAAAHGQDPGHADRAAELLVLTRVHPDLDAARAALDAAQAATSVSTGQHRLAEAGWRLASPLTARAGAWLGLRLAARLLPGATVLVTTVGNSAAVERLAARSVTHYRRLAQSQSNQSRGSTA